MRPPAKMTIRRAGKSAPVRNINKFDVACVQRHRRFLVGGGSNEIHGDVFAIEDGIDVGAHGRGWAFRF